VTDQTPEARLAAALLAALKDTGYLLTHEYADSGVIDVGDAMVRADPTLAADLALAAAVRELEDITEMSYDPSLRRGQWDVRINDHVGVGDTLTAAIKAAKEASDE